MTRNQILVKNNSIFIHHKNIQALAIEMFNVKYKLRPEITSDTFIERSRNQYNLQNHPDFITPHVNILYHEPESITHLGPNIWDTVPKEIK